MGGGASAEGACVGRLHLCTELVASGRVGPNPSADFDSLENAACYTIAMIPSDSAKTRLVCTYVRSVLLVGTIHPTMPDRTCTLYTRSRALSARRRTPGCSGASRPAGSGLLTQRSIANGVTTPLLSKPLAMSGRMASCARAVSSPCRKSRSHASATPPMAPRGAWSAAWPVGPNG